MAYRTFITTTRKHSSELLIGSVLLATALLIVTPTASAQVSSEAEVVEAEVVEVEVVEVEVVQEDRIAEPAQRAARPILVDPVVDEDIPVPVNAPSDDASQLPVDEIIEASPEAQVDQVYGTVETQQIFTQLSTTLASIQAGVAAGTLDIADALAMIQSIAAVVAILTELNQ